MARQRRGSGGRDRPTPTSARDLPTTLSSLLRSTLEQVTVVGEAALERARSSGWNAGQVAERITHDNVVLERKRRDTLARLGEAVYVLALRGELGEVADRSDVARMLSDIENIDEQLERASHQNAIESDDTPDVVSSADWRPPEQKRGSGERMRVWRPVMPNLSDDHHGDDLSSARNDLREDIRGQAAADTGAASKERDTSSASRDSRSDDVSEQPHAHAGRSRRRRTRASDVSANRGGIEFVADQPQDPDDDLSEYMHDDDVPDTDHE